MIKEKSVKDFYNKHYNFLIDNYPGLTINRLFREANHLEDENEFFNELLLGTPLEYINGKCYFYKSEFLINNKVFIPRSETEVLVEAAVNLINQSSKESLKVLELGVGCGAIILSILNDICKKTSALALDISENALKLARDNYKILKIPNYCNLEFRISDQLDEVNDSFDFIFSNPPYIKKSESSLVHEQTNNFEPHNALYIQDELYYPWFKKLFWQINNSLVKGGIFIIEGSEYHLDEFCVLANSMGLKNCSIINDLTGTNRFIMGEK